MKHIWEYAQSVAVKEDDLPDPPDFTTINTEKVQSTVNKLNEVLGKKKGVDIKTKNKLGYITKHYPANSAKYELQEAILEDRKLFYNSRKDCYICPVGQ
ncbi:hypothetical protein [Dyadobacter sp. NIV53]|uniref:hypothetical protein n=1 Tax=Dyadobacter sp. NIV53 TaxID=2861765 RepID=UPI001E5E76F1|nr:hypothetical protein [Dyadobacter sp. NIV53]